MLYFDVVVVFVQYDMAFTIFCWSNCLPTVFAFRINRSFSSFRSVCILPLVEIPFTLRIFAYQCRKKTTTNVNAVVAVVYTYVLRALFVYYWCWCLMMMLLNETADFYFVSDVRCNCWVSGIWVFINWWTTSLWYGCVFVYLYFICLYCIILFALGISSGVCCIIFIFLLILLLRILAHNEI